MCDSLWNNEDDFGSEFSDSSFRLTEMHEILQPLPLKPLIIEPLETASLSLSSPSPSDRLTCQIEREGDASLSGYCSSIDYFTPYSVYDVDAVLPLKSPAALHLLSSKANRKNFRLGILQNKSFSAPCSHTSSPIGLQKNLSSSKLDLALAAVPLSASHVSQTSINSPAFSKRHSFSISVAHSVQAKEAQEEQELYKNLKYHECIGYGASGTVFKVSQYSQSFPDISIRQEKTSDEDGRKEHELFGPSSTASRPTLSSWSAFCSKSFELRQQQDSLEKDVIHSKDSLCEAGGNFYALKSVHMDVMDKDRRKKLLLELLTLRKLNSLLPLNRFYSKFIVQFRGAFLQNGDLNILTEFMDLGSLTRLLEQPAFQTYHEHQGVPEWVLQYVAYSIVKALTILQKEWKILHRDIKPRNILMDRQGHVKLCDFGLATCLDSPSCELDEETRSDTSDEDHGKITHSDRKSLSLVGTFAYMSPERVIGHSYDSRSDSWSLAVSLLELMLGYFPLSYKLTKEGQYKKRKEGKILGLFEQIMWVLSDPIPVPSNNNHNIMYSKEMSHFLETCLIKDPSLRPSPFELLLSDWFKTCFSRGCQQEEIYWYQTQRLQFKLWVTQFFED